MGNFATGNLLVLATVSREKFIPCQKSNCQHDNLIVISTEAERSPPYKDMEKYYVYILANKGNSVLYVGVTNDVTRRVYEHKTHQNEGFTSKYNLSKLVYLEEAKDVDSAIEREKQIKRWRRSKKEDLINSQNPMWEDLYF